MSTCRVYEVFESYITAACECGGTTPHAHEGAVKEKLYFTSQDQVSLQTQHNLFRVNHCGVVRIDGVLYSSGVGLYLPELLLVDHVYSGAVGDCPLVEFFEGGDFFLVPGDNYLSGFQQRQFFFLAVVPHKEVAAQTRSGLQTIRGIVNASVQHSAVAPGSVFG